jgi:hypothetical protein
VIRRALPLALCLALVGLLAPAPAAVGGANGAGDWSVSASTDLVKADFASTSVSDARLYLENHTSIELPGLPEAGVVLDALGFGGGYSQEVDWSNSGGGPVVSCPEALVNLPFSCATDGNSGWAIIPDGLRTELRLVAPGAPGNRALDVRVRAKSLAYDASVAAIGIVLETLSPGPISTGAGKIATLALKLIPEAAGLAAAMQRGDYTAAAIELLSLTKRALKIIADHVVDFAIGGIVDALLPGMLEVKFAIAVSKAMVVLANLDSHLLGDYSISTVSLGYGGGSPAVTPTPTPSPAASWTSLAWTSVPAGQAPPIPPANPDGGRNAALVGWSKGYVEFVWDPHARTLTPWTSTDGIAWQGHSELDLGVWNADLATYDSENPGSESHDACTFTAGEFQEGPTNLLLRGLIDCYGGCGGSVMSSEAIWTSPDGLSWTPVDMGKAFGAGGVRSITGGSSGFIALGQADKALILWLSSDGANWRQGALPAEALAPGSSVNDPTAFAGGYVLPGVVLEKSGAETAGGSSGGCASIGPDNPNPPTYRGALWWSVDGTTWTRATLGGTTVAQSIDMRVVRIDDHTLVATQRTWNFQGDSLPEAAWVSRDGRTWTPLTGYPIDDGAVVAGRSQGLIYLITSSSPMAKLYVVDNSLNVAALDVSGTPPPLKWPQMVLGPAGLLVTDDGSQFWLGIPR